MHLARALAILAAVTFIGTMLLLRPIAQDERYHDFADQRELLKGVPNTLDVVSNGAFAVAALMGFAAVARSSRFQTRVERDDAVVFFVGIALTSIGSTIYHLHPSDATLPYDRAGMTVGFMAFVVMLMHEHLGGARWLLPVALAIGAASICWWVIAGDLRPYGWVQFFPVLALVLIFAFGTPRYSGERSVLAVVFLAYAAAKVLEAMDRPVFLATGHLVSGHTLKHVAAAVAPAVIAMWIARRRILALPRPGDGTKFGSRAAGQFRVTLDQRTGGL